MWDFCRSWGIAAGLAAVAGGSALAVGVTIVLSRSAVAAISTIFGVGGAGLAGYRRCKGRMTEFDFEKEQLRKNIEAELFSAPPLYIFRVS